MQQLCPTTHAVLSLRALYEKLRSTALLLKYGKLFKSICEEEKSKFFAKFALGLYRVNCCCFFDAAYCSQGRYEVRWRPGHEASLAPPCSNLRSFGSKCIVLKKVLVTLLGLSAPLAVIQSPCSDSAPRELCPLCTPRYACDCTQSAT